MDSVDEVLRVTLVSQSNSSRNVVVQNGLKVKKLRAVQSTITFRVAGNDENLETLSGFLQDGQNPRQPTCIRRGQHVIKHDELALSDRKSVV